jgi:hypothetical protein
MCKTAPAAFLLRMPAAQLGDERLQLARPARAYARHDATQERAFGAPCAQAFDCRVTPESSALSVMRSVRIPYRVST